MFKTYRLVVTILVVGMLSGGALHTVDASASIGTESEQNNEVKLERVTNNNYIEMEKFFQSLFSKPKASKQWQQEIPKQQVPNVNEETVEQPKQQVEAEKTPIQKETNNATELNAFEQEVFDLTNEERVKNGLPAFEIHLELSKVAREKSRDIAINNYFAHNSPVYGSPFDMMQSFGVEYRTAGENIAKGQRTPTEVVNAWMNSPGHRANILNDNFTHIGLGYIENGDVWTQQFIGK